MVELNNKLVMFTVGFDIFIITMLTIMPLEVTSMFTSQRDYGAFRTTGRVLNESESNMTGMTLDQYQESIKFGIWHTMAPGTYESYMNDEAEIGVWDFIGLMFGLGLWGISGLPVWISIPFGLFISVMNYMLIISLISYIREVIGFT